MLQSTNHPRHAAVTNLDLVQLAALAAEGEVHLLATDVDVLIAQGRQAERLVLPHIFLVADPDQRLIEEADDGGSGLGVGEAACGQICLHPRSYSR